MGMRGPAASCLCCNLLKHTEKFKSKRAGELPKREPVLVKRGRSGVRKRRNLGPRIFWKGSLG